MQLIPVHALFAVLAALGSAGSLGTPFGSLLAPLLPDQVVAAGEPAEPAVSQAALQMPTDQGDPLDVTLYARILKSADRRVLDSALIETALDGSNAEIRRVAARTVSQLALRNRAQALPLLRAMISDRDSSVASSAMFGLGLVRDTASVAALVALYRQSSATAIPAAWALGEMGAPAADAIAGLLEANHMASPSARSAVRALLVAASRIRPVPIRAILPYIASPYPELRWAAAYAVARQRSSAGVRQLLNATAPDAAFRAELARELTSTTVGDSLRDAALGRLRRLATDPDPHVRINALRSIATFGLVARPVIRRALNDPDSNVRITAAQSAGAPFDTVMTEWQYAWAADTGYKFRSSLLASASAMHLVLDAAMQWSTSPDWHRRSAAVSAWSGSRDTARAREAALGAAHDTDARVREVAYRVLAATDTARQDSVVQHALGVGRTDPDAIARGYIPGESSPAADTSAVDRPLAWYQDAVRRVVLPALRGHAIKATLQTVRGPIVITLDGLHAPLTVLNYATLADKHTYDGLSFHRVVPAFVAQDGDPRGDGEGGPGYAIRDELTLLPYTRGAVGMALSGPDTGGSQYFLTLSPQPHLTGHYTVFAVVTSGLGAMDALVEGDAVESVAVDW